MAGVEMACVSKRFGDVLVIDKVSLEVQAGEFIVFLGPSGCGKSTLLRMIAGLETVDDGTIHIGEQRVDTLPPGKRDVAMVFQHYALYPHMTIKENLAFGLKNRRVPASEISARVEAAASSLEIGDFLERRPGQLSGGQRQRAAIARAIVKQPSLFLFDEPLSNLDAALRARTRIELAQLHQQLGTTMIFVTHDQVEAMTLADRIVVLHDHRIEQIGTPMEIYRRPATKFVASFVGTPKINIVELTAAKNGAMTTAALPDGTALETCIPWNASFAETGTTLGLRPEAIRVVAQGEGTAAGRAKVVERLGERTLIYAELSDGTMLTTEDRGDSQVRPDDMIGLSIDSSNAVIFTNEGRAHHGTQVSN
ncbi:ABC transporter ATP-binding protein [Aurantiacibacter suaedae]|uniref:ABC transporter ATP-binding protein n=1 Tax=Aurantiacibacter suaedae TaxID=2545755 RepID=UPI001F4FB76D|nr:sn-glycerol-3-phosphate ABC transporter ATP-binding protein UgpC [Aurantiacibacter suaedae]